MFRWLVSFLFTLSVTCFATSFDEINLSEDVNPEAVEPILNDRGDVVFRTEEGLYRYTNGQTTQLLAAQGVRDPHINNRGQIAYVLGPDVYLSSPSQTPIDLTAAIETSADHVALNNQGQVAFQSDGEIYLFSGIVAENGEVQLRQITESFIPFALRPSLNDLGQIAFQTLEADQRHVYYYDGASYHHICSFSTDALPSFGRPSLNAKGQIAFERRLDGSATDILFYDGQSVTNLSEDLSDLFAQPDINDAGQIVRENRTSGGIALFDLTTHTQVSATPGDAAPRINNTGQICYEHMADVYLIQSGLETPPADEIPPVATVPPGPSDEPDEQPPTGDNLPSPPEDPSQGVGHQLTWLTADITPSVFYPDINNLGDISAHNASRGVYLYSGDQMEQIYEGKAGPTQINDHGQIVFEAEGMIYQLVASKAETIGPGDQVSINNYHQLAVRYADDIYLLALADQDRSRNAQNLTESLGISPMTPSLNDAGWVSFAGSDGHIYLYDGIAVRRITERLSAQPEFHDPVINNQGWVAFAGAGNVYLYDGSYPKAIVENIAPTIGRPSLNDSGHIAFDTDGQGRIYYYDGYKLVEITDGFDKPSFRPVLNNREQVAFYTTNPGEIYIVQIDTKPEAQSSPTLQLVVAQTEVSSGAEITMLLQLDTHGAAINGLSLELEMVTDVLDADTATPGVQPVAAQGFLPEGMTVLNDTESGKLRFSYLSLNSDTISGSIGTIQWLAPISPGQIEFVGSATASLADGTTQPLTLIGTTVNVIAPEETRLEGRIQLQGRAEHDAILELLAISGDVPPLYRSVNSDAQGNFRVELPPDTYDLYVGTARYLWGRALQVEVGVEPVTVEFEDGSTNNASILLAGDADGDDSVGLGDFAIVAASFGTSLTDDGFAADADMDGNGAIGLEDFSLVARNFGLSGMRPNLAAPTQMPIHSPVQIWRELSATGFDVYLATETPLTGYAVVLAYDPMYLSYAPSPGVTELVPGRLVVADRGGTRAHFRGSPTEPVHFLSGQGVDDTGRIHLLEAQEKPRRSELLPNYPNPFNPETWIPYQLADTCHVVVQIHSAQGKLVRSFNLGEQAPGKYTSRERALYWDGRNSVGESVSSGTYFCTIRAGQWSATRKMVVMR